MKIFSEYIAYLKDNPEGYWFKRKLYGWGWAPAKWQGWLVMGVYVGVVVALVLRVDESMSTDELWSVLFVPLIIATSLLFIVAYAKGETPRWQWGPRQGRND